MPQKNAKNDFSFFQLLRDIKNAATVDLPSWKDFEDFVEIQCRKQDNHLVRQCNKYPDIILNNGIGLETKLLTDRLHKSVNLNSTCPGKTYYIFGFYKDGNIQHAAIVHGLNYCSPDMREIQDYQKGTRSAKNPLLKYRTRLMWEVESPFKVYNEGFFIVDRAGGIIKV